MINLQRFTLAICLLALTGSFAIAKDTHGSGKGFSTVTETVKIEGKSGFTVHNTTTDFWHYENAPEGWPAAVMATCHQSMMFKAGSPMPVAINMTCESVDADGDATVWVASVNPKTGEGKGELVAGTGKYENATAKPSFRTVYQIDTGHSVYTFKW